MVILFLSLAKGEASLPQAGKPASGGQACLRRASLPQAGRVRVYTIFRNNALIIHGPSLHLSLTKGEKQWSIISENRDLKGIF